MPLRTVTMTTAIAVVACLASALGGCASAIPRHAVIATSSPGLQVTTVPATQAPTSVPQTSTPMLTAPVVTVAATATRPSATASASASGSVVTGTASPGTGRDRTTGTATTGRSASATAVSASTLPGGSPVVQNDPVRTVQEFLSSLQYDPSGTSSIRFLGQNLASTVKAGRPVPAILGMQTVYHSFDVAAPATSVGANTATVTATLHLRSSSIKRVFTLTRDRNVWKITGISDPS